ncbi:MAG: peptidoglycan-binding protein LysM [Mesonia hippocampi]|uniref:peptidoglycan-binding protein LysM n=1 Tax=Mesonia hippocampi TaxID=1628250 RepID=UPI003F98F45D
MKKKVLRVSLFPVIAGIFMFFGFSENTHSEEALPTYNVVGKPHLVPNVTQHVAYPILQKDYTGFKEAVGFKESQGNYKAINTYGYMGKYQFGRGTLALIGIKNTTEFLNSPVLQEAAFYANASRNKWILRREIKKYVGKEMKGVEITESGILAAAHLAGPGSVKKYLRSNGYHGFKDAYGTSVRSYLKRFKGYDTSIVTPDRTAKANK